MRYFSTSVLALVLLSGMLFSAKAQDSLSSDTTLPQDNSTTQVEDVLVEGRRGLAATTRYVRTIAPPIGNRSLARWNGPICVGVANMQAGAAQAMADRVSDWAFSFGIQIDDPGCEPNIFIVATDDGPGTAKDLVTSRPNQFRIGVAGADRGPGTLDAFQNEERKVRWWHVSLPVNPDTGLPVSLLPGQQHPVMENGGRRPSDFGPNSVTISGSRLIREIRDDLQQVIVVVDLAALETVSFGQLTDHVAMVALAQIDMRAPTDSFPSILNIFDPGQPTEPTLTDWDKAFLTGLYSAEQNSTNSRANASAVADIMRRELERASVVGQ